MFHFGIDPSLYRLSGVKDNVGTLVIPTAVPSTSSINLDDTVFGKASFSAYVELPPAIQPSIAFVSDDALFILDDGITLYLLAGGWEGGKVVNPVVGSVLSSLLNDGKSRPPDALIQNEILSSIPPNLRMRMRNVFTSIRLGRPTFAPLVLVSIGEGDRSAHYKGCDVSDIISPASIVMQRLVNHRSNDDGGYVAFLCRLHQKIRDDVTINNDTNVSCMIHLLSTSTVSLN